MKVSGIWQILIRFKELCKHRGWRTSESEDWIEVENSYHNFVWVKNIHPSSFKKIATNNKCVVREGLAYRVVESSYTAWLFSQMPSDALARTVLANSDLSRRIALYDLSSFANGKNICAKLNRTHSSVFREFEGFLENDLKIELQPFPNDPASETSSDRCAISELA